MLITLREIRDMGVPYSTTHINRLIRAGEFPRPVKFGSARNSKRAWVKGEVEEWLLQFVSIRDSRMCKAPDVQATEHLGG